MIPAFLLTLLPWLPRVVRECFIAYYEKAKAVEVAAIHANKELGLAAIEANKAISLALIGQGYQPPKLPKLERVLATSNVNPRRRISKQGARPRPLSRENEG